MISPEKRTIAYNRISQQENSEVFSQIFSMMVYFLNHFSPSNKTFPSPGESHTSPENFLYEDPSGMSSVDLRKCLLQFFFQCFMPLLHLATVVIGCFFRDLLINNFMY